MTLPVKRRFLKRKWILLGSAAVIALVWWEYSASTRAPKTVSNYAPVTMDTIEEVVTAQGKLQPKEYVDVGAQVSGQLKKLHVELGDTVTKGTLLAEIDPMVYQARVNETTAQIKALRAQVGQAEAQLVLAKQIYERNQRLIEANAVSKEVLQQSEASYKVAVASVSALKAQIEQASSTLAGNQTNLNFTKIYAPIDGTVMTNPTRQGQTVNANQQAPVIVQLANLDVMTVTGQVAEADIPRLTVGMPVSFTTLGSLEHRWHGTLRQILPSPEVVNDVVLYNALVDVDNKDRQLMSGMSTQMYFEIGKAENVMTIPVSGLGKRKAADDNEVGQAYQVRVKQGDQLVDKVVHVGRMDRLHVEIKDGLDKNDQVSIVTAPTKPAGQSGSGRMAGPRL